jgi:hypothetical protein
MKLKPCECHDQITADKLTSQGIRFNDQGISIHPNYVLLEMGHTTVKISMQRFKMFAEWYLKPQSILRG